MSPLTLFMSADIVVKAVMIGLLAASVWTWAIIFSHALRLRRINRQTEAYERDFWAASDIDGFHKIRGAEQLPLGDRVLHAPPVHEDPVDGDHEAGAIHPGLAVDEDGLVLRREDHLHRAHDVLGFRVPLLGAQSVGVQAEPRERLLVAVQPPEVDDRPDPALAQLLEALARGLRAAREDRRHDGEVPHARDHLAHRGFAAGKRERGGAEEGE
jgi:hypothetical protein